jgi:hypothetical protein
MADAESLPPMSGKGCSFPSGDLIPRIIGRPINMAGDWIKVEENMPDKPEVWRIASILGIDGDTVAGKLFRVWAWASRNCNADGVTNVTVLPLLDRCAGVKGFCLAMQEVGWLIVAGDLVRFPNFERHCSQTAKDRANANRRVAKHRAKCNAKTVTDVTPPPLQKPLPEKRRKDNTPIVPKGDIQLRAEALVKRRVETPPGPKDQKAFKAASASLSSTTEEQWQALEAFYAAPQETTFARKDLVTLLNNWNGEIDRAMAWTGKNGNRHEPELKYV